MALQWPAMAADLGARPVVLSLAITAYLTALAIFIPASGWFGGRFPPRRIFIVAIVVFILGSIGSAMAVDIATLTAARFVQGTGGAMMVPVGRLLVLRTADRGDPGDRWECHLRTRVFALSWMPTSEVLL